MRVLAASTAGEGHFEPMVPFVRACMTAGHQVRVAAPGSFGGVVERAGFEHLPLPDADPDELGAVFGRLPAMTFGEANATVVREVFAGIDARSTLPAMDEAIASWRPDLVLRESAEFSSYVAAERHGVTHVEVSPALAGLMAWALPLVDEPLRALGARRGSDGLWDAPVLSPVPLGVEGPDTLGRRAIHRFRYEATTATGTGLPGPWGDPEAPLAYVSFGTVAATIGLFPSLYRALLDALADRPVRVLVTLGAGGDAAALGPLPENAHVEQFWPQREVMPYAGAIVGHGGFGTTMTALAAGVPQVVLPLFAADQRLNADAVARSGIGRVVGDTSGDAALPDPADLADLAAATAEALAAVLDDPAYAEAARSLAAAVADLPSPASCASLLESLATSARPHDLA